MKTYSKFFFRARRKERVVDEDRVFKKCAQGFPQINAEIAEKGHFWTETR
jgi:hypothetical protein